MPIFEFITHVGTSLRAIGLKVWKSKIRFKSKQLQKESLGELHIMWYVAPHCARTLLWTKAKNFNILCAVLHFKIWRGKVSLSLLAFWVIFLTMVICFSLCSYLRLSMDQFNRSTNDLIRHMARKADGKTRVRMLDELSKVTMDVIAKVNLKSVSACSFSLDLQRKNML